MFQAQGPDQTRSFSTYCGHMRTFIPIEDFNSVDYMGCDLMCWCLNASTHLIRTAVWDVQKRYPTAVFTSQSFCGIYSSIRASFKPPVVFFCSVQSIMRLRHLYSELSVYMEYFMSFGAFKPILIRIWPHQNVRRDNTFRYRCSGHMM